MSAMWRGAIFAALLGAPIGPGPVEARTIAGLDPIVKTWRKRKRAR